MWDRLEGIRNICWLQACAQRSFSCSPYERRAKERAAVLAIQHLLGHLATLFQHKANINPAFTGIVLGQCWIVWPGLEKYGSIFYPRSPTCLQIPFHMRKQIVYKLEALESQGITNKATGPTPWISSLVVIPKKDGDVRLCIDMRISNRAILRERYPTLAVDDLIHTLNGAKVVSKMDLRSGYHQLLLNEDRGYITIFQTQKGRRRSRTLNSGTSSAIEIFHHSILEGLRDIPNALNISDDVIVFGKMQADHDVALENVFKRLSSRGLTLNRDQCVFSKDKLILWICFLCEQYFPRHAQSVSNQERARSNDTIWITQFPRNGNVQFQIYCKFH